MKVIQLEENAVDIDAASTHYRDLNEEINRVVNEGVKHIIIRNVMGQRFIGAGLQGNDIRIDIHGVAGNDLAVFMDGPTIEVFDNAQDGVGNTMNAGRIYIHGHAGDVCGYGMRGGKLYVRGEVDNRRVGKEVGIEKPDDAEYSMLKKELAEFAKVFHLNYDEIISTPFVKLYPKTHRPYGPLYNSRWFWQRG